MTCSNSCFGAEVAPGAAAELAGFMRSGTDMYRKIIQVSGTSLN